MIAPATALAKSKIGAWLRVLSLCLGVCILLCGLILTVAPLTAEASVRVPYVLHIAELSGQHVNVLQESMYIRTGYTLPIGEGIQLSGWLATEEGVDYYEYAWGSADGGSLQWNRMDAENISARPDLGQAGILYPTGHATAGFDVTAYPEEDMVDGYYDLYVRAVTGGGHTCDVMVLVNVAYGAPDVEQNGVYHISLPRLEREQGALKDCEIRDNALVMKANGIARLGELNLASYESIRITYSIPRGFSTAKQAVLGLKSSGEHPYGAGNGKYNMTDSLLYLPIETVQTSEPVVAELDLTGLNLMYSGEVYLCGYTGGDVIIHGIELSRKGQGYTKTAAKLYMSDDLTSYFHSVSKVSLTGEADPVFGDVLRFTVSEDTNDPYAFFNAEAMMADNGVILNADQYRYMVLLVRSAPHNSNNRFIMYLCAGMITGPTEDCTYGIEVSNDGEWHYYLVDLSEKATWGGRIHGWRFDVLNGDSKVGDYVDVATVQFFRTAEAAQRAADASVTACDTPYAKGQPALYQDMQEEMGQDDDRFVISPEDAYVETQAETQPPVEPEDTDGGSAEQLTLTLSTETNAREPLSTEAPTAEKEGDQTVATPAETETETVSQDGGCTSAYGAVWTAVLIALFALAVLLCKRRMREGMNV